jgi:anti-sigma factor RsiW
MTDVEFEDLTVKVLAGDASPAEMAKLRAVCAANPERRMQFEHLRQNYELLRENAALAEAMHASGPAPAERRREFQALLARGGLPAPPRRRLTGRWVALAILALAVAVGVAVAFLR